MKHLAPAASSLFVRTPLPPAYERHAALPYLAFLLGEKALVMSADRPSARVTEPQPPPVESQSSLSSSHRLSLEGLTIIAELLALENFYYR